MWEALRALYLVGQPEDIAAIRPYEESCRKFPTMYESKRWKLSRQSRNVRRPADVSSDVRRQTSDVRRRTATDLLASSLRF